jgi:hypothetical protein
VGERFDAQHLASCGVHRQTVAIAV